jgi:hypothetical protein
MIEKLERRTSTDTHGDAESRVEVLTCGSDLTAVAVVLSTRRDEILARWLEVTGLQPFHAGLMPRRHLMIRPLSKLRRLTPRNASSRAFKRLTW